MNNQLVRENFAKCVRGYHKLNASPINETMWEDLNALIFRKSGTEVTEQSDGGHAPGMDLLTGIGGLSNKSAKYASSAKASFDISSYRLTTVCSAANPGTPAAIIEEINRRKNFDFYSILARTEQALASDKENALAIEGSNKEVEYDWILCPADHKAFNPAAYEWTHTIGKRGKNKDSVVGWHTNVVDGCKMSITFSMSSQLWIHVDSAAIKLFVIASEKAACKPTLNYIDL
jgi:hypothetical protein